MKENKLGFQVPGYFYKLFHRLYISVFIVSSKHNFFRQCQGCVRGHRKNWAGCPFDNRSRIASKNHFCKATGS